MKTALSAYNADKKTLANFADKLIWRMEKVISQMSPQNFQYVRTKNWVEFSKLWVQENRIKLIGEIG
ncbi:MAG TPA: hypothetical protein DD629_07830 [Treponema sp.]|nr:hypothetical protein [Treponema sp.]